MAWSCSITVPRRSAHTSLSFAPDRTGARSSARNTSRCSQSGSLRHRLEVRDDLLNLLCADARGELIAALALVVGHLAGLTQGLWARDPFGEPFFVPVFSNAHGPIQLDPGCLPALAVERVAGETGLAKERETLLHVLFRRRGRRELHGFVGKAHEVYRCELIRPVVRALRHQDPVAHIFPNEIEGAELDGLVLV